MQGFIVTAVSGFRVPRDISKGPEFRRRVLSLDNVRFGPSLFFSANNSENSEPVRLGPAWVLPIHSGARRVATITTTRLPSKITGSAGQRGIWSD